MSALKNAASAGQQIELWSRDLRHTKPIPLMACVAAAKERTTPRVELSCLLLSFPADVGFVGFDHVGQLEVPLPQLADASICQAVRYCTPTDGEVAQ